MSFFIRSIGTTLGSLWGWAAFEARGGDPVVCVAMLFIGLLPAVYVQLGSQHAKAGMVAMISMSVVALSTELQTVPGQFNPLYLICLAHEPQRHWD
jgi:high-affinity K+ transport system ATPase subunit B